MRRYILTGKVFRTNNMLNLNSVMIGSMDPKGLAAFYEKIMGKPADSNEGKWFGWSVGSSYLSVGEHSDISGKSKEPQRVMFNFETTEVKEEFERIKMAGATVIKEPYEMQGMWIATFADPEGNFFQLMSPWTGK